MRPAGRRVRLDDATIFRNVQLTDGLMQVQAPLVAMHAAGVTTYVLGLGELAGAPEAQANLAALAGWGSGGMLPAFTLATQSDLEAQLVAVVESVPFSPFVDCNAVVEPDPTPGSTSATSMGAGTSTAGGADPSTPRGCRCPRRARR